MFGPKRRLPSLSKGFENNWSYTIKEKPKQENIVVALEKFAKSLKDAGFNVTLEVETIGDDINIDLTANFMKED